LVSWDGSYNKRDHCIEMATNSFTLAEVKLLCSVLLNNFGIESTINSAGNKSKDQYRIRIPKRELPKLPFFQRQLCRYGKRRSCSTAYPFYDGLSCWFVDFLL
jgi:hypothetical protein